MKERKRIKTYPDGMILARIESYTDKFEEMHYNYFLYLDEDDYDSEKPLFSTSNPERVDVYLMGFEKGRELAPKLAAPSEDLLGYLHSQTEALFTVVRHEVQKHKKAQKTER